MTKTSAIIVIILLYIYGRKKTYKLQVHPCKPVSWSPTHRGISPDEWATKKQACRDELVVYLFFFLPYILRSTSMY